MATAFTTSKDIYLEINGKKLAVAQNYKVKTQRESRCIEAFGSAQPVGTIGGRVQYQLELTRVCLADSSLGEQISFYDLSDFNVVIVKPDCKVIYTGCQWSAISEDTSLGDAVLETVSIVASGRMEVRG